MEVVKERSSIEYNLRYLEVIGSDKINTTVGGVYMKISKNSIFMCRQLDNSMKIINLINYKSLWDRRFIICNNTKYKIA